MMKHRRKKTTDSQSREKVKRLDVSKEDQGLTRSGFHYGVAESELSMTTEAKQRREVQNRALKAPESSPTQDRHSPRNTKLQSVTVTQELSNEISPDKTSKASEEKKIPSPVSLHIKVVEEKPQLKQSFEKAEQKN